MATDEWDEEKTKTKLKAALMAINTYENGGATCLSIIRKCEECYGQKPSVERFGYRNLATFMRQYPDYFIEQGNCWVYNPSCLTATDRSIINDIQCSNTSKGGKRGRGGGRGGSTRGRGGGPRGGYGYAFKDRPQGFNNGYRPGFSTDNKPSVSSFSQHDTRFDYDQQSYERDSFTNRDGFSGRGSAFSRAGNFSRDDASNTHVYDRGSFNNERNRPRHDSPNRYDDKEKYYNDDDYDRSRNSYSTNDFDKYPRDQYRSNGSDNASSNYKHYDDEYDKYEKNQPYRNDNYGYDEPRRNFDNRPRSPSPVLTVTRYPFSAFLPPSVSPPPGIYYRKGNSSTGIVGEQTTGHAIGVSVSPPPGFDEAKTSVANQNERPQSAMSQTSQATSNSALSVGKIANKTLEVLSRIWPQSLEFKQISELSEIFPASSLPLYAEGAIDSALQKVLTRFRNKDGFKEFVHIEEDGNNIYFTYNVGIDNIRDRTPELVFKVATNYLEQRGPQEISTLAKMLGIESKGGQIAMSTLYTDLVDNPNFKTVLKFHLSSEKKKTVSLIETAVVDYWRPQVKETESTAPIEKLPPPSPKPETPILSSNNRTSPNFMEMIEEAKKMASNSAPKYFKIDYLPFFNLLERDGLPDNANKVFMGKITNFVDLNNFWVRTESDEDVFRQLLDDLIHYYKAVGEPRTSKEGQMVAACRYNSNDDWWYIRGIVLEKSRKFVLIRNIDEGSVLRVRTDDIFALPDYYSKLPALATRCSVGKLKTLLSDKEMNDLEAEEEAVGEALLKRTVSFKLHGIADDEHIIIDVEVPLSNGKVKYIPKDMAQYME